MLQGGRYDLFETLAKACRELDAELLIAYFGGLSDFQARKLLRAGAAITHGGLNTVLDAIASGTPLLAIPLAFNQPGIAARLVHHLGIRASPPATS
ncbi:hypothetical protein EIO60_00051|nr:hypothetical protein [Candidatus Pantoea persica]